MKTFLLVFISFTAFISCKNDTTTLIEKNIIIPKDLELFGKQNKTGSKQIISYINGNCPSCLYELKKWDQYKNKYNWNIQFIIYAEDQHMLEYFLKKENLKLDYFLDKNNKFLSTNKLIDNKMQQTFIINKQNNIVLTGNPVLDSTLVTKYNRKLSNN